MDLEYFSGRTQYSHTHAEWHVESSRLSALPTGGQKFVRILPKLDFSIMVLTHISALVVGLNAFAKCLRCTVRLHVSKAYDREMHIWGR